MKAFRSVRIILQRDLEMSQANEKMGTADGMKFVIWDESWITKKKKIRGRGQPGRRTRPMRIVICGGVEMEWVGGPGNWSMQD